MYVKITGKFFLKPISELKLPVTSDEKTLLANETLPQASKGRRVSIVDTCKRKNFDSRQDTRNICFIICLEQLPFAPSMKA